jgi:hypothetical protein
MKTPTASYLILFAVLATCAGYAADPPSGAPAATPAPGNAETLFQQLDTDKDGYVSRTEAAANKDVAAGFDKADVNADYKLDPNEFAAALAESKAKKQ